jgi:hypothetical protein
MMPITIRTTGSWNENVGSKVLLVTSTQSGFARIPEIT